MNRYPLLTLLVQAYLTLDWPEDYDDPWMAIDDFIASEPQAATIVEEVNGILRGFTDDEIRELVIDTLGSWYRPDADGWTTRSWLEAIVARVAQKT